MSWCKLKLNTYCSQFFIYGSSSRCIAVVLVTSSIQILGIHYCIAWQLLDDEALFLTFCISHWWYPRGKCNCKSTSSHSLNCSWYTISFIVLPCGIYICISIDGWIQFRNIQVRKSTQHTNPFIFFHWFCWFLLLCTNSFTKKHNLKESFIALNMLTNIQTGLYVVLFMNWNEYYR